MKHTTRTLVECAIMIAIGTVLNEFIKIRLPMGGGITACSMLPLVMVAHRHGTRTGLITAFAFSLLQLVIGMNNVQYGTNVFQYASIVLFDYVVAYTVIGLSAVFDKAISNKLLSVCVGIAFTFTLRFACHFYTGWVIWDALWPNSYSMSGPVYSLVYNGSYMIPEMVLTMLVVCASYSPLKKFWLGEKIA